MEKTCPKCKDSKDTTEFGLNKRLSDGLTCYCKQCNCELSKENRLKHPETNSAWHRKYYQDHKDKINNTSRQYYKDNKEKIKAYKRTYHKSEAGKKTVKEYYEKRHDSFIAVYGHSHQTISQMAIKANPIEQPCIICGSTVDVERHHPSYYRAEDIVWYCRSCHAKEHVRLREGK